MNLDLRLPEGTRLVTVADDPGLPEPMSAHNAVVCPEFMLHDPVASSPDLSTDAQLWCGKC